MSEQQTQRQIMRRRFVGSVALACIAGVSLLVYARATREAHGAYALAADLPRGALVYAQCADLPALVKLWDESNGRQQLLRSTSWQQFAQRHLALKLVERWTEYNDALGFTLDAGALAGATQDKAAIAIYDIGRLDLVLVAPIGEEQAAAAAFFTHKDSFEETALPDGTPYYRREAEVDRGRQRQMFAFAWARGRFVLATDERLLLRTLANINGHAHRDRLADDPAFQTLSRELAPHLATVWVDQSALNRDWYFKSYWVQRNVAELQSLRAGLFDLEVQTGKWIERRRFLTSGAGQQATTALPTLEAQRLAALMPADAPYYKVRAVAADEAGALLGDALFDRAPKDDAGGDRQNWSWRSYDDSDFAAADETNDGYSYEYLDQGYDRLIDDPVDARLRANDTRYDGALRATTERGFVAELQRALAPARPLYAATAASPRTNAGPLFVEFRRAAALTLAAPAAFERAAFERAMANLAQSRLTIAGATPALQWMDGGGHTRTLALPMSGRQLCYALNGRELLVANDAEMLQAILNAPPRDGSEARAASQLVTLDELSVIRLDQRRQAFDQVFARLDAPRVKAYWAERKGAQAENAAPDPSQEFFSGNVASLLDVAARVRAIEIKHSRQAGQLHEELEFNLQ